MEQNIGWDSPNVPAAIGISVGAGLATAVGGAVAFVPSFWKRVPQTTVLAISLALSAGVMLYVSFIEIFAKSYAAIASVDGMSEGAASAITTTCFFAGMGITALLELLVHFIFEWRSRQQRSDDMPTEICACHMEFESEETDELPMTWDEGKGKVGGSHAHSHGHPHSHGQAHPHARELKDAPPPGAGERMHPTPPPSPPASAHDHDHALSVSDVRSSLGKPNVLSRYLCKCWSASAPRTRHHARAPARRRHHA